LGSRAIRVFLVDDHEVVRRGVAELLKANDDIDVVGEASSVKRVERWRSSTPWFSGSPDLQITGAICGVTILEVEDPIAQQACG
jgi:chemotaxis response regulator CheB